MDSLIKDKPYFFLTAQVKQLCQALYLLKIDYFTLDRIYPNDIRAILTTHPEWITYYYSKQYYHFKLFNKEFLSHPLEINPFDYVLWSDLSRHPVYHAAAEFGIHCGITLIIREKEFCDFFNFGSSLKYEVTDTYLISIISLLKKFSYCFKERAVDLIKQAEQNRIELIKPQDFLVLPDSINYGEPDGIALNEFFYQIKVNKICLGKKFHNNYITQKELACIAYLIQGDTSKEIAKKLNISFRTVEAHVNHIKEKFSCNTLCELGVKLAQSCLLEILLDFNNNQDLILPLIGL